MCRLVIVKPGGLRFLALLVVPAIMGIALALRTASSYGLASALFASLLTGFAAVVVGLIPATISLVFIGRLDKGDDNGVGAVAAILTGVAVTGGCGALLFVWMLLSTDIVARLSSYLGLVLVFALMGGIAALLTMALGAVFGVIVLGRRAPRREAASVGSVTSLGLSPDADGGERRHGGL